MEERLARLELSVEHIQSDVSEMKGDMRRLNDKIEDVEQKLIAKIDGVEQKLITKIEAVDRRLSDKIEGVEQKLTAKFDTKFDSLKDQLSGLAVTMERTSSQIRVWVMGFCITMAGSILTFLAHSLHWF